MSFSIVRAARRGYRGAFPLEPPGLAGCAAWERTPVIVSPETTPFPLFLDDPYEDWRWPSVPFEWAHASPDTDAPRPCRVEDLRGHEIDAQLIEIDPLQSRLSIRTPALPQTVNVPLNRVRRLTLTEPLVATSRIPRGRPERLPVAAQTDIKSTPGEYDLVLTTADGATRRLLEGRVFFDPAISDLVPGA